jgi:hypothetical protein
MNRVAFGLFLRLYPRAYRLEYGPEVLSVLERRLAEREGLVSRLALYVGEVGGLIGGAAAAWIWQLQNRTHSAALATASTELSTLPEEVREAKARADAALGLMLQSIAAHKFEKARQYSFEEKRQRLALDRLKEKYGLG